MKCLSADEQTYDFASEKNAAFDEQAKETLNESITRVADLAEEKHSIIFYQTNKIALLASGLSDGLISFGTRSNHGGFRNRKSFEPKSK